MLRLKNVSKYYYNKGVIAAGFTRVSIEFKIGEFVAIVGESGSGKSTLLNVISGLDTYEEGEMYINDEETSHYSEIDFEDYRKRYVSNIFQSFNLVNSYTVRENVELVLLLNGYKRKEIKSKVLEIIDRVGLLKYKNTKVAKLSGGQKQRVAIARALAKETPIIVCDEPTGNLDSKSAKEIIKLLKEISKYKLVIVVTHNFKEIEDLATRVVTMNDGKIISDKNNLEIKEEKDLIVPDNEGIGLFNTIRLGIRNTFNIIPKFILIFAVNLFITISLLTVYGNLQKSEYEETKLGYNNYFNTSDDKRIVIKKSDGSMITDDDYDEINKIDGINYIVKKDIILDKSVYFDSLNYEYYYGFSGNLNDINTFTLDLDYGRMPNNKNEAVVVVSKDDWYFSECLEDMLKETFYADGDTNSINIKVVGVKYADIDSYQNATVYVNSELLSDYMIYVNQTYSTTDMYINGNRLEYASLEINDLVPSGNVYMSDYYNYLCKDDNCLNKNIKISVNNIYYEDSINEKILKVYNKNNIKKLLNIENDDMYTTIIYINSKDYNKLFDNKNYQSSVFVSAIDNIDDVCHQLEDLGYSVLQVRNTLYNGDSDLAKALKIIKLVVIVFMVITLFFISYFVIKLILKSRNVYFSTLRILGAKFKNIKRILDVELIANASVAYISYIAFILLVKYNYLDINFIRNIIDYLSVYDYILMYFILIGLSYLVSFRFSRKIFCKSAMNTYREEI